MAALEAKVGVDGSAVTTSLDYKVSHGAPILLEEHTANNTSQFLNFTASISATYDEYLIEIVSLTVASNGAGIGMGMSTDGGQTYDSTSGHYSWCAWTYDISSSGAVGSNSDTYISFISNQNSAAKLSYSGTMRLYNPMSTALYKLVCGFGNGVDTSRTTTPLGLSNSGKYLIDSSAVNAFRITATTGNLVSGTVRVYGIAK